MVTRLISVGEGLGIVLDPSILDRLKIDGATLLEVTVEGRGVSIRPVEGDHRARVLEAADRIMDVHEETLRKLAL